MKKLKILILFLALIFYGCPEEIESIIGDSNLRVINDCDYNVKVYFDDSYIGKVDSENEKIWSVPSGMHTVKATCNYASDYKESHFFNSGQTTVIRLEIINKFSLSLIQTVNDSISIKN